MATGQRRTWSTIAGIAITAIGPTLPCNPPGLPSPAAAPEAATARPARLPAAAAVALAAAACVNTNRRKGR
jgi:hypothetical protein